MNGVAHEPLVVVRSPALRADFADRLLSASDPLRELWLLLREWPEILATVWTASPSLADACEPWIRAAEYRPDPVAAPALAYVLRCASRCTPLSACSAVGIASAGDDGPIPCSDTLRRRTRPDTAWLLSLAERLESRPEIRPALVLWPSGLLRDVDGRTEVVDFARTGVFLRGDVRSIVPVPTTFKRMKLLDEIVDAAECGARFTAVADLVRSRTGVDADAADEFVATLCAKGILVSSLRLSLIGSPVAALLAVLDEADAPEADCLRRLGSLHGRADGAATLGEAVAVLRAAAGEARALHPAERPYQIDCAREVGPVPRRVLDEIRRSANVLMRIARTDVRIASVTAAFETRYNAGREVPLLDVLDPDDGFAFEIALDRSRSQGGRKRARLLHGWCLEAYAAGTRVIELDEARLRALEDASGDLVPPNAAGVEIFAHLQRDELGCHTVAISSVHHGAYRSLGRFLDLFPEDTAVVAERIRDDAADAIAADLATVPHARIGANVAVRPALCGTELLAGAAPSSHGARTLHLDDLLVGTQGDRFFLRSRSTGTIVRVIRPHMLNPFFSNRLDLFLDLLLEGHPKNMAFAWDELATELPYRPRVRAGECIVALASWSVPAEIWRDAERFARWRAVWPIPDVVGFVQGDNRLPVNLSRPSFRALIEREAKDARTLRFEELFPAPAGAALDGRDGSYHAELALTLERPAERTPAAPAFREVSRRRALRPAGSDWTTFHLYVGPAFANAFLQRRLRPLVEHVAERVRSYHFLRYRDDRHHLRFRVQAEPDAMPGLVSELIATFGTLVDEGELRDYSIVSYDREIERYGGLDAIGFAEACFCADSAMVLSHLESDVSTGDLAAVIASTTCFVTALFPSTSEAIETLRRLLGRRRKLEPRIWDAVKRAAVLLERFEAEPVTARVRTAGAALSEALGDSADRDRVYQSLIHMHCNRIGLDSASEAVADAAALAMLDQRTLRTRPAS